MTRPNLIAPPAGQESVWDDPRPPDPRSSSKRATVEWSGNVVAAARCPIDGAIVVPQPGNFYGGSATSDVVGPFKGLRGSLGW